LRDTKFRPGFDICESASSRRLIQDAAGRLGLHEVLPQAIALAFVAGDVVQNDNSGLQ